MENRAFSKKIAAIGRRLIRAETELEPIRNSSVRIGYLLSDLEKKQSRMPVLGECEKVPDKYKWKINYDFLITIFEPNTERLTEEQLKILVFHELLHIGIIADGNEETYEINRHDIEDFKALIDRYGIDWAEERENEEA